MTQNVVTNPGTALSFARTAMARAAGWGAGVAGAGMPVLAARRDRFDGIRVSAVKPAPVPTVKQLRLHVPLPPLERRP